MENMDKALVLIITILAAVLTWKMVFDFYKVKLHKIFAHLIAVATSSFMFLSTMLLFVPTNYERGNSAEVEFSAMSLLTVVVMVAAIYLLFRYIPQRSKNKEGTVKKTAKKNK